MKSENKDIFLLKRTFYLFNNNVWHKSDLFPILQMRRIGEFTNCACVKNLSNISMIRKLHKH